MENVKDHNLSDCNLHIHQFSDTILKMKINFTVLRLKDSFILWIGSGTDFPNLTVAMENQTGATPGFLSTQIFGDITDVFTQTLALRLTKKFKKQVFVSCAVLQSEHMLLPLIEKRLNEEIESHSDQFFKI